MEGFLIDPRDEARPPSAHRAELRERVVRDAAARARAAEVELVARPAGASGALALLWFQGDRTRVLRTVGGWDPGAGLELRIAHAERCGGRYELALYVLLRPAEGPAPLPCAYPLA